MSVGVRDGHLVSVRVCPPAWIYGEEKYTYHALVPVQAELAEELWTLRRRPRLLGAFILNRGYLFFEEQLAQRLAVPTEELDGVGARLTSAVPELAPLIERLAGDSLPRLAWERGVAALERFESFTELHAPDILLEQARRRVAELVLGLSMPSLIGYGAGFNSRNGLTQEAASLCVRRPVENLGFAEDVELFWKRGVPLSRPGLPRAVTRPGPRCFFGHERIYWLSIEEAQSCLEVLGASADEEQRSAVEDVRSRLARSGATAFFSCVSRWRDFVSATGSDLDEDERHGVFLGD